MRRRGPAAWHAGAAGRRRSRERRAGDDTGMPNYLIRKKFIALGDDFWVEDDEGRRIFHVDGKALRLRKTFVIETSEGEELVQVKERKLSVRKTMTIERRGEEVATVRKALVTPLRDSFEIEVAGGGVLNAQGDILDHEFTIAWENDVPFAQVSKRWFAVRDAYGLAIEPDQDAVLALAIAVSIDAMERDEV
jgi:uncharacterized protein YxjI